MYLHKYRARDLGMRAARQGRVKAGRKSEPPHPTQPVGHAAFCHVKGSKPHLEFTLEIFLMLIFDQR